MESMQAVPRIIELFDSTCIKQFESMGCEITQIDKPSMSDEMLTASIDAVSDNVSVVLFLSSSRTVLKNTMPTKNLDLVQDPAMQEDWNLELANRFVARLKNKLLSHNCVLKMGLPKPCYEAEEQKLLHGSADNFIRFFKIHRQETEGVIECCLFITLHNKNFTLEAYEDEDEDWFAESELDSL